MNWAKSRERRDQLVLFPTRLAVTDAQNDKLAFPVTDHHDSSQAFCAWSQAADEGLELRAVSNYKTMILNPGGVKSGALSQAMDLQLEELLKVWPYLSTDAKNALLVLLSTPNQ